ncbi:hypothetical protein ACF09G_24845 [Streptomyces albogriseolus]|nr:hypothetical protein [Streptomyces sp. DH20]
MGHGRHRRRHDPRGEHDRRGAHDEDQRRHRAQHGQADDEGVRVE